MSAVEGGKFAKICAPANVFAIVLSDIIGDPLDMIASGPAYPDSSSAEDCKKIIDKYNIDIDNSLIEAETPKELDNVETVITGSVTNLCKAAGKAAKDLGYRVIYLTDVLACEAKHAGTFLSVIARSYKDTESKLAIIVGGESIVHLSGDGLGGRNQEFALSTAKGIKDLDNVAIFSVGSDGTDGPTDAAGGYVDGNTYKKVDIDKYLNNNDSYHALKKSGGLIMTGPTGTNVNDVSVALISNN